MTEDIRIRAFDPDRDMGDALLCFRDGFHHCLWPLLDHAAPQFIQDCIRVFHRVSRQSFAAEIDGQVCAILFGAAPFQLADIMAAGFFMLFRMLPRLLLNTYRFKGITWKHFLQCVYGFSYFAVLQPPALQLSEIMLFTSRRNVRGLGIGRTLMDAYMETLTGNGQKKATVCTDSSLSYDFYESYGFDLIRKFNLKAYKYSLPDGAFTGLIYRYIPGQEKQALRRFREQ